MRKSEIQMTLIAFILFLIHAQTVRAEYQYNYNKIANECCYLDWGNSGWFTPGAPFPEAKIYSLTQKKNVNIKDLVKARPIVLELGSMTCPAYDLNIQKMKELKEKYKGQIDFYTVYVRENHPSSIYKFHTDFQQKVSYAEKLKSEDNLEQDILIDDVEGSLHQKLGKFGNSVYLIGKDMRIAHWSMFTDPPLLQPAIDELLKNKGLAASTKSIQGTDLHPIAFDQYTDDDKRNTFKKMKSRMSKEDMLNASDEIKSLQEVPAYQGLTPEMKEALHNYLRTVKDTNKRPFLKGLAMREYQIKLRAEYRRRFEKWLAENKLKDRSAFATQIKEPSAAANSSSH